MVIRFSSRTPRYAPASAAALTAFLPNARLQLLAAPNGFAPTAAGGLDRERRIVDRRSQRSAAAKRRFRGPFLRLANSLECFET
jgi:hypothetical protein